MNPEHRLAQLALRAWPFPEGSGRLVDKFFSNLVFRSQMTTVPTKDGFEMTVNPSDLIGRHIYLKGDFDSSVVQILCDFAHPGDRLLDIGANIGYVSATFLHRVSNSSVVAVEPQPAVLSLLERNLIRFGRERFSLVPCALSDKDGEMAFQTDSRNSGAGRISEEGPSKVGVRSADNLFRSGAFEGCTLVKVDVEGHEEQVFRSCSSAFSALKPRVIVFEEHGTKAAPDCAIGSLLTSLGYEIFAIKKKLTGLRLSRVRGAGDCTSNDYAAVLGGLVPSPIRRYR